MKEGVPLSEIQRGLVQQKINRQEGAKSLVDAKQVSSAVQTRKDEMADVKEFSIVGGEEEVARSCRPTCQPPPCRGCRPTCAPRCRNQIPEDPATSLKK